MDHLDGGMNHAQEIDADCIALQLMGRSPVDREGSGGKQIVDGVQEQIEDIAEQGKGFHAHMTGKAREEARGVGIVAEIAHAEGEGVHQVISILQNQLVEGHLRMARGDRECAKCFFGGDADQLGRRTQRFN